MGNTGLTTRSSCGVCQGYLEHTLSPGLATLCLFLSVSMEPPPSPLNALSPQISFSLLSQLFPLSLVIPPNHPYSLKLHRTWKLTRGFSQNGRPLYSLSRKRKNGSAQADTQSRAAAAKLREMKSCPQPAHSLLALSHPKASQETTASHQH